MRKYHQFVSTVDDVVQNAKRFAKDLEDKEIGPALQKVLPLVHHWYGFTDEDGHFLFVPSKFAGYKNMTGKIYLAYYNLPKAEGGLHGKDTELALDSLSILVDEESETPEGYGQALFDWLAHGYLQKRRRGSTVSVLKGYPQFPAN